MAKITLKKILEVNVDDLYSGGVFSFVKYLIINKPYGAKIDIASMEHFEKKKNINLLTNYGTIIYYIGYTGNKLKKQFACYLNLKKLLNTNSYDYVHIHADVANKLLILGLAAKNANTCKIILHSHAAGVDGKHRNIKLLLHIICRPFLQIIGDNYVACSDYAAKWMFPSISKDRIAIINNGVDLEKFRFNIFKRKEIRKKLGLKDEILIGHVGRFAYQKNHEYLISIMHEIKEKGLSAKMILVGEGPNENRIRNLAKNKQVENNIIFYGTCDHIEVLFHAMDIFVLPSHFEGLPIVGVEAQAAGLPVLFSEKITRKAKLTTSVEFLPISKVSINRWILLIQKFSKYNRRDTYQELKENGFSIENTINAVFNLYK